MIFMFSNKSLERRKGVDPRLIEISDLALGMSLVDFGIPRDGGVRTAERQRELFDLHRSQCDGIHKKSPHQSGRALDVYAYVDGRSSWDEDHLAMVACAMLQAASQLGYKLEWGGLWRPARKVDSLEYGWDMAHFELIED